MKISAVLKLSARITHEFECQIILFSERSSTIGSVPVLQTDSNSDSFCGEAECVTTVCTSSFSLILMTVVHRIEINT